MKYKEIIASTILCLLVLFTTYIYRKNDELKTIQEKNEIIARTEWLLLQSNAVQCQLPTGIAVTDIAENKIPFVQLASKGARVGMFISNSNCKSCWLNEVDYLYKMMEQVKGLQPPFILASNNNYRERRIIYNDYSLPFPLYHIDIDSLPEIRHLILTNKPFLFILHPNGVLASVLFPTDAIRLYMKAYFENLVQKSNYSLVNENDNIDNGYLEILNPVVELGKIGLREKQNLIFQVKNRSNDICFISNVHSMCDCILNIEYPDTIASGETGEFKMEFFPTFLGSFSRKISFQTNLCEKPDTLVVKGKVS